jgi:hypothetical protein
MKTSYYSKYKGDNGVSIALSKPKWYSCREYKKVAPNWNILSRYKQDGDEEEYIKEYYKQILDKLDPLTIYNELGENAVLLCWESSEKFCHRHIVAEWLMDNLGVKIEELKERL